MNEVENVFIHCENVWTDKEKKAVCKGCKEEVEPCGWFETKQQET